MQPYGWVIALATAMQESGLHNLDYGDRDSVGLFQQRTSTGWGTLAQIQNPQLAAEAFFGRASHTGNTGLLDIDGWEQMPITVAAQAVQRSGFPDAYAQHEDKARELVSALAGGLDESQLSRSTDCAPNASGVSTTVVMPLAEGNYIDQGNYGNRGSSWASMHTGNDYSAACGTPVRAVTGGRIRLQTGGGWSWAGHWLVQVETAPGALTTWYAHMETLRVREGQQVSAGTVIGTVGGDTPDDGNSSGCHLHLEVHPKGGGYLQDQVDPKDWLANNVGKQLPGTGAPATVADEIPGTGPGTFRVASFNVLATVADEIPGTGPGTFRVASFNVLGNSHTGHRGDQHAGWPGGRERIRRAGALLEERGVSIAGLQELEGVQARTFRRAYSGHWDIWYPGKDTRNAVVWRKESWQMIGASSFKIPYIRNHVSQPVVLLQNRTSKTRVYVINVHNASNLYGQFGHKRSAALRIEARVVNKLLATGIPVLLMGDFNDRDAPTCAFSPKLTNALGGPHESPCRAASDQGVDHIYGGGSGVTLGDTRKDQTPRDRKISDHPLLFTTVSVEGGAP